MDERLTEEGFKRDIEAVGKIPGVATMLDVICQSTGMGFAAIARVTEDRWITCTMRDDLQFGLKPGDELEIKTTICNEIRQHGNAVAIDNVAEDPDYQSHRTPAFYGLQSYISMPIFRKDGSFFGTLCAIDPKPNQLKNTTVTGMFTLFADLISFHLGTMETLKEAEMKLEEQKAFNDLLEEKVVQRTQQLKQQNLH